MTEADISLLYFSKEEVFMKVILACLMFMLLGVCGCFAAGPDFWHPRAVMAKKAATGEVTPAAKKEAAKPADKK